MTRTWAGSAVRISFQIPFSIEAWRFTCGALLVIGAAGRSNIYPGLWDIHGLRLTREPAPATAGAGLFTLLRPRGQAPRAAGHTPAGERPGAGPKARSPLAAAGRGAGQSRTPPSPRRSQHRHPRTARRGSQPQAGGGGARALAACRDLPERSLRSVPFAYSRLPSRVPRPTSGAAGRRSAALAFGRCGGTALRQRPPLRGVQLQRLAAVGDIDGYPRWRREERAFASRGEAEGTAAAAPPPVAIGGGRRHQASRPGSRRDIHMPARGWDIRTRWDPKANTKKRRSDETAIASSLRWGISNGSAAAAWRPWPGSTSTRRKRTDLRRLLGLPFRLAATESDETPLQGVFPAWAF